MKRFEPWQVYLGAGLAGTIAFFLLPGASLAQMALFMGVNLVLVVALAAGPALHRPEKSLVWRVLLAAQVPYVLANIFWYVLPAVNKVELSFPGPHDPLYLGAYAVQITAVALLIRARSGRRNRADLIDATIVALGMGLVLWEFQIDRVFTGSDMSLLARGLTAAYPFFDLVLFGLVVRLAVAGGRRGPAFWFLGLGVVCQLLSDVAYTEAVLRGTFRYGAPFFALYFLTYVLIGTAALHPSMRDLTRPVRERRRTTLRRRLPFMAIAALIGPLVILVSQIGGDANTGDVHVPFVVIVTSVIFLLVLARVSDLMVDVAEYEKIQEQLSSLAVIVESTDDAVVGWSTDGTFTSWNAGATKLYGYEPEEAIGQPFALILPPHRFEEAERLMRRLLAGDPVGHFESERRRKDGSVIDVSVTLSPLRNDAGRIVGGATIARDISEAKQLEADLAVARDRALDASRMKSQFLATMSHEIRTPMNGVIGLTGLLLNTSLDDRQRQYADGVRAAGDALLTVINDILDFSKIEAGKLELETADFDLRQVVEDVAALMADTAQAKGLELLASCDPQLPAAVAGDAGRLRQILINLAGNAVKFTEQGEVVLSVKPVSRGDDRVVLRFEVIDTGIGIAAADHHRLFDPFSQTDASTTRRYGGTGLGLAICNQLVAAMDGQLGLDSEAGRGSRFWFELPLRTAKGAVGPIRPSVGLLDGLAVLVVDDNATNRLILETQLRSWGMVPELCDDGPSALSQLRQAAAAGTPYRLAVLDMSMADMNGLELARHISNGSELAFTDLILLTSAAGVEVEEARGAGIAALLTKPVRQSQLYDALEDVLAPPAAKVPPSASASPARARGRGHILIVEDNSTNQMVALGILSHLGWTADVVGNGLEAVEAVERAHYAAVLMDCEMPEMDGYTATAEIRRREGGGRRIPIIAMTASAVEGDRERCLGAGMDDYVVKPVTPEDAEAVLSRRTGATGRRGGSPAAAREAVEDDSSVDQHRLEVLRRMGPSDGSLFARMVGAFLDGASDDLPALGEAVARGDGDEVRRTAHRLRGAAANLGAVSLAQLCAELEAVASSGDLSATEIVRRAETELSSVASALRAACEVKRA